MVKFNLLHCCQRSGELEQETSFAQCHQLKWSHSLLLCLMDHSSVCIGKDFYYISER